jgi:tetratricopeptide (TPR) repeat protein
MVKNKKRRFYKKVKPKEEPKQLPKNSRFITENLISDHLIFFIGITCIILAIIVVSLNLYSGYQSQKDLENQKRQISANLIFWQNEIKERPNYRDGYFSLALLYYQLKDYKNSSDSLEKAMEIDPNFEKGKELRQILKEK